MAIVRDKFGTRSSEDIDDIMKHLDSTMKKWKESNDAACKNGDHTIFLRHTGFSGGMINWRCENCGECISNPDTPMTI